MSFYGRRYYGARYFGPRYFGRAFFGSRTGDFAATEGADSAAFTGLVPVQGTLAATDGADEAAFTGYRQKYITLDATEGADEASFSGSVVDFGGSYFGRRYFGGRYFGPRYFGSEDSAESSGTIAATDGADSAAFTGTVLVQGTLAATDGADSADFTGDVLVQGTFSGTDGADDAAFAGDVLVQGTFSGTEGADAAALVGLVLVQGLLAAIDGADEASFAGDVLVQGTFSGTDGADGAAFLDDIRGSFAATDGADDAAFTGQVIVQGTFSGIDGADGAAFTGQVIVQGTFSGIDGADGADFEGHVNLQGSFTGTDSADSAAFTGQVIVQGVLAATDGADAAWFIDDVLGTYSGLEGADSAAFTGTVLVQGIIAATDGADSASFTGAENEARPGYVASGPVWLLEFEAHNGSSVVTIRLTSGRSISTKADDSPAETIYYSGMMNAGTLRRTLFENGGTVGRPALNAGYFEIENADGARNAWLSYGIGGRDFRLYSLADRSDPVSTRELVFTGTLRGIESGNIRASLRLRIRDKLEALVRPFLTVRYAGTSNSPGATAEGDSQMNGELKPMAWGYNYQCPVKPANSYSLIYQSANNAQYFQRVSDGGELLTAGSDYANLTLLEAAVVSAGTYATCNALGLFKLGAAPEKVVTVELRQDVDEADLSAGAVAKAMLIAAGVSSGDIDDASFTALTTSTTNHRVGIYLDKDVTVLDAVCQVLNSIGATLTATPLGKYKAVQFGEFHTAILSVTEMPPTTGHLDTFTEADVGGEDAEYSIFATPEAEGDGVPAYAVMIKGGHNWRTLSDGDMVASVGEALRHNAQREYWIELAQGNLSVLTVHPLAAFLTFETLLNSGTGIIIEGYRKFILYGERRDIVRINVPFSRAGDLDLGNLVRLDIDGSPYEGVNGYLIGREDNYGSRRSKLTVWV